jgi:hypothetical protein
MDSNHVKHLCAFDFKLKQYKGLAWVIAGILLTLVTSPTYSFSNQIYQPPLAYGI